MARIPEENEAWLYSMPEQCWFSFTEPVNILETNDAREVPAILDRVEEACENNEQYAAGYVSYEAGVGFDRALIAKEDPGGFPVCRFTLYSRIEHVADLPECGTPECMMDWKAELSRDDYAQALASIKERIRCGDTYQVNFTFRLRSGNVPAWPLFCRMVAAQGCSYGAYLDMGRWIICSASPELFIQRARSFIESRPMKGTAPRSGYEPADAAAAIKLSQSAKERAENVMIVDMVRNDLGRISRMGSVRVAELFKIERFPTVWQMTSRVISETAASLGDVFRATFPPASITGAPKANTMGIIASLERSPRRVYTGAVGYVAPGRKAQFNVAIRTALIDRVAGEMEYGVGGGIVWDSEWKNEYEECQTKAQLVTAPVNFSLLETLLYEPEQGYFLLARHLERAERAAEHFGFRFSRAELSSMLQSLCGRLPRRSCKVRVLVSRKGHIATEFCPIAPPSRALLRARIARDAVNRQDRFLYHKTTYRNAYEAAWRQRDGCDDVILWNREREVTESCYANVVARIGGVCITPPVSCGLLAGTFRAELLACGMIREELITMATLEKAERIWLINSVRKWREVDRARLFALQGS